MFGTGDRFRPESQLILESLGSLVVVDVVVVASVVLDLEDNVVVIVVVDVDVDAGVDDAAADVDLVANDDSVDNIVWGLVVGLDISIAIERSQLASYGQTQTRTRG